MIETTNRLSPGILTASRNSQVDDVKAFSSDDELLEAAAGLFNARKKINEAERHALRRSGPPTDTVESLRRDEASRTARWNKSVRFTKNGVLLCQLSEQHSLDRVEFNVLVLLVLSQLSLLDEKPRNNADIVRLIADAEIPKPRALRALADDGKLVRSQLIVFDDPDEEFSERTPIADPSICDRILGTGDGDNSAFASSEEEFYLQLSKVTRLLGRKNERLRDIQNGYPSGSRVTKLLRQSKRLQKTISDLLEQNPDWKLKRLFDLCDGAPERLMLLALIGKELGHLSPDDNLFTGGGLSRGASCNMDGDRELLGLLKPDQTLVREKLIQPCGGEFELTSDEAADLERVEFELTAEALKLLDFDKKLIRARSSEFAPRKACTSLAQLVLPDDAKKVIDLAIANAQKASVLIDDWGLGELIPYGRGLTLLFSGTPGTGKTATAEALANELDKPILVADYSRIQNCFVGQTEKNIVRVFREAKKHEAVLFWDEADAMFFDRDDSSRTWEVRDVNVILQQLERFDGVCILATNRIMALDKALERRIAMKVIFERPDKVMRQKIWKKLLPEKMPIGGEVNLDTLAEYDLSGGEIKNVVLNAARSALLRDTPSVVTKSDFDKAVEMELKGCWSGQQRGRIGF